MPTIRLFALALGIGEPDDGHILGGAFSYAGAETASNQSTAGTAGTIGQRNADGFHTRWRFAMPFDVPEIPGTVTAVEFGITIQTDSSTLRDFEALLVAPAGFVWPIAADGNRQANFAAIKAAGAAPLGVAFDTGAAGFGGGVLRTVEIDPGVLPESPGILTLGIVSARDAADDEPSDGNEFVTIRTGNQALEVNRPYLDITYTEPEPEPPAADDESEIMMVLED